MKGLQNPGVHGGNDVDGSIELFLRKPRFPCVRKAPFDSRIAQAHHRDRQADKDLLAIAETLDRMGITIELAKIGAFQFSPAPRNYDTPLLRAGAQPKFITPA